MPDDELKMQLTNEILRELSENCRRYYWKAKRIAVYAEPKCPYCDTDRNIKATAANGQVLEDRCRCSYKTKGVWKPKQEEFSAYSIGISYGHAVIIPAKTDYRNELIMAYWVDPDISSKDNPPSFDMLYNSVFSTKEKLIEYIRAAGEELWNEDMQEA